MKKGKVVKENIVHEDRELIKLKEEIQEEETKEERKRKIDVHNLNIGQLDDKEKKEVDEFLEDIEETRKFAEKH